MVAICRCRLKVSSGPLSDELLGYTKTNKFETFGHCCYQIGRVSRRGR